MGRKLVGSAQRRMRGGVLQHGSIRLTPDPCEVTGAVGFAPGVATSLAELGVRVQTDELEEALKVAFRTVLEAPGGVAPDPRQAPERRAARRSIAARPARARIRP
jgi:lipoate-protein ligase A